MVPVVDRVFTDLVTRANIFGTMKVGTKPTQGLY